MKKLLLVLSLASVLVLVLWASSAADDNKTLNATITPLQVSMSLSHTEVSYGIQQAGAGEIPSTPESITVTNTGTVAENFLVRGGDSVSSDWLLDTTAGQDRFVHKFSNNTSNFADMTTAPKPVQSNVAPAGNFNLYLRLVVPTTITKTAVQTLPIYITAVQKTP